MAIVRPYGDPNARGSLNETLTFRRYRNKVILQSFIRPTPTFTPLQLAQRARMTAANKAYSLLTNLTKWFYHKRSTQTGHTRKGLFMRAHMRGFLPSTRTPIYCKAIEDMIIYKPAGFYPDNLEISIYNVPSPYPDTLYNPLDNKDDGTMISNYGQDGYIYGTINLVPAKFDDGIERGSGQSGVRFPAPVIDSTEGFYSFWFITDFDVIDGRAQGITNYHYLQSIGDQGKGFYTLFQHPGAQSQFTVVLPWHIHDLRGNTGLNWTAGTPVHVLVAWDHAQTTTWSSAIFIQGLLVSSDTDPYTPPDWSAQSFNLFGPPHTGHTPYGRIIIDELLVSTSITSIQQVLANRDLPGSSTIKFYGILFDNSNEFTKLQEVQTYGAQVIRLSTMAGHAIQMPFRYLITVSWLDHNDVITNSTIRLPQLTILADQVVELFLSRDWSVYWDPDFKRLACASRL